MARSGHFELTMSLCTLTKVPGGISWSESRWSALRSFRSRVRLLRHASSGLAVFLTDHVVVLNRSGISAPTPNPGEFGPLRVSHEAAALPANPACVQIA